LHGNTCSYTCVRLYVCVRQKMRERERACCERLTASDDEGYVSKQMSSARGYMFAHVWSLHALVVCVCVCLCDCLSEDERTGERVLSKCWRGSSGPQKMC
jgi:hypothetical protein